MSSIDPVRRRVLGAAALLAAGTSRAHGPVRLPLYGPLVQVSIINRTRGERLPSYPHGGRDYVIGTPGDRYAIELANRTAARVLAVVSVDGINAVTGETALWAQVGTQAGYVFAPWQRWQITGWRKSHTQVAAFEFTSLSRSYAARTGRPMDVGVIGVALFRERVHAQIIQPHARPQWEPSGARSESADRAQAESPAAAQSPAASAPAGDAHALGSRPSAPHGRDRSNERLGTGHGAAEYSRVTDTEFERASALPDDVITLYYDRRENLIAAGVLPPEVVVPSPHRVPQPFPGRGGFVPDPAP
ncbi:MAG: hypothetical protein ING50_16620 [Burkholderiales bacterium]|jgi:hypothetical protein|nr:hypothetical protein [Burkholderiales bacterium]